MVGDLRTARARDLRANQTKVEAVLWASLRNRQLNGFKFRRQAPVGRYVADFLCESARLIIELDGSQHAEPDQVQYDAERTRFLEASGYCVIRFWNNEVVENPEDVLNRICAQLEIATP